MENQGDNGPSLKGESPRATTEMLTKGEHQAQTTQGSNPSGSGSRSQKVVEKGPCKSKRTEIPQVIITYPEMQVYNDHMTTYALIHKFMGFWPIEKAPCLWIKQQWKSQGDVQLLLG